MAFNIRKTISFKYPLKKDRNPAFTQLHEADDSYAAHSTDSDDIEANKRKTYANKRAKEAEEFLARHGFAGGIGGGAMRGLR